ncbi:pilus assembly protein TadG-related protein [Streptomyces sp. BE133]|uniref:pilus assembly protein TadG-related protein n=1 Tax=Streptomyces sp. BE133 TaxID=3002523 RepID=UPI002E79CE1F|nr:pilus assembly protein TadG-related protein [Streptomyces sp. BE133]MEE1807112.1 pilus assembly protein TadG-related protein [Streptomyces sp. BE133]
MIGRKRRDAGQAFPIYVVMVAGLLFLVFAFFAVGKAAALRNGAQGAADAAALAAAQQTREDFEAPFLASLPGDMLEQFLQAHVVTGCSAAQGLAAANQADVTNCRWTPDGYRDRFTVQVKGLKPVDSSVIPGSKKTFAEPEATAIVEFRCPGWQALDFNDDGVKDLYIFQCRGAGMVEIAPSSPPPWSQVSKILYDVHLVDN